MKSIKRIKRELAYKGTILNVYKDYMETENNKEVVWDFIHHDGAAAVIPVRDLWSDNIEMLLTGLP